MIPRPCVAVVTPFKATYYKPLWEAFAGAQPSPWRTAIVWPENHQSEHPEELLTPQADNLDIELVGAKSMKATDSKNISGKIRYLPSRKLWQTLARLAPQAIIIHEYSLYSVAGLAYAKRHSIPVIILTDLGRGNRAIFSGLARTWHFFCSLWVNGVAAATPSAHVPMSGRRIPTVNVYHAVDSRLYRPLDKHQPAPGPVVFVTVGQFIHRKGFDLWFKAARMLLDDGLHAGEFRLRIIGQGERQWLNDLAREYNLEEYVEVRGFLSGEDLRLAMGSADVFVLPTRQDSYAVVTHEAACLGLPLLISKHAGSAEAMVREDENGHIIDPEETRAFANRMKELLSEETRLRMSRAAALTGEKMSAHSRGKALWHWLETTFLVKTVVPSPLSSKLNQPTPAQHDS